MLIGQALRTYPLIDVNVPCFMLNGYTDGDVYTPFNSAVPEKTFFVLAGHVLVGILFEANATDIVVSHAPRKTNINMPLNKFFIYI